VNAIVRLDDTEADLMLGFISQLFPRFSETLRLHFGWQDRGWPLDDFRRVELRGSEGDGVENIGGWYDEQVHGLAFLFRKS